MAFDIIEKNVDITAAYEWVPYPGGGSFKINAVIQPEFQRVMEIMGSEQAAEAQDITLISRQAIEKRDKNFSLAIGLFLVSDWKDVDLSDGTSLEYNQKNVDLIFHQSAQAGDLIKFVIKEASRIQQEAVKKLTDEVGKSSASTDTPVSQTAKKQKTTTKNKQQSPKL